MPVMSMTEALWDVVHSFVGAVDNLGPGTIGETVRIFLNDPFGNPNAEFLVRQVTLRAYLDDEDQLNSIMGFVWSAVSIQVINGGFDGSKFPAQPQVTLDTTFETMAQPLVTAYGGAGAPAAIPGPQAGLVPVSSLPIPSSLQKKE